MTDMSLKQQNNDTTEKDIQISDKPVAWMLVDKEWNDACRFFSFSMENAIPLYTAPRELSDDEIVDIWGCAEYSIDHDYDGAIKFARAILKKASEK
jgi:hypothetical protein